MWWRTVPLARLVLLSRRRLVISLPESDDQLKLPLSFYGVFSFRQLDHNLLFLT